MYVPREYCPVYMCVSVCNTRTYSMYHLSSLYLYIIGTCTLVQVSVLCPYAVYICLCRSVHVSPNHTTYTPPLRIRRAVVYFYDLFVRDRGTVNDPLYVVSGQLCYLNISNTWSTPSLCSCSWTIAQ